MSDHKVLVCENPKCYKVMSVSKYSRNTRTCSACGGRATVDQANRMRGELPLHDSVPVPLGGPAPDPGDSYAVVDRGGAGVLPSQPETTDSSPTDGTQAPETGSSGSDMPRWVQKIVQFFFGGDV